MQEHFQRCPYPEYLAVVATVMLPSTNPRTKTVGHGHISTRSDGACVYGNVYVRESINIRRVSAMSTCAKTFNLVAGMRFLAQMGLQAVMMRSISSGPYRLGTSPEFKMLFTSSSIPSLIICSQHKHACRNTHASWPCADCLHYLPRSASASRFYPAMLWSGKMAIHGAFVMPGNNSSTNVRGMVKRPTTAKTC